MRSRRTSASVTPTAGGEAEDRGDGAGAGFVDPQSVWDELERHGDESPGAFEEERVGERDCRGRAVARTIHTSATAAT